MKTLKQILAIACLMNAAILTAQQQAYVAAESGLTVRQKPDVSAKKIGQLAYGQAIGILEETDIKLVVLDAGKKVSGEWVKIASRKHTGFVFNGYLSNHKIVKPIHIHLKNLNVDIQNLATQDYRRTYHLKTKDSATIKVGFGSSPEGKTLVLANNYYKNVSIFQAYENSLSFISDDSVGNVNDWKSFDSMWKPLKRITANTFETLSYTEADWLSFVKKVTENLKPEIIEHCGEDWLHSINHIENIKDYPLGFATSRIYLKFILTDINDNITETLIEFEIPEAQ